MSAEGAADLQQTNAEPVGAQQHCANCGALLAGPYCAACGQRHQPDVRSFWHFASEALENITHADSRLWRTLWPLIAKPGFLTREFFDGHRARYLPPFRLYLVISLLFFVIAAAAPGKNHLVRIDAKDKDTCTALRYSGPGEKWLQPRLTRGCQQFTLDGGKRLTSDFLHNVPRALFVFLPLLALAMKLAYWRPRRYYVEHLLFFIHTHACAFLVLGAYLLLAAALPWLPALQLIRVALAIYFCWYIYRALRVAYGQSRRRTLLKYAGLTLIYTLFGGITMALTLLFSFALL